MLISCCKVGTIPTGRGHKHAHQRAAPIPSNLCPRALCLPCIYIANVNQSYTLHDLAA